ncbi:MAG: DNA-formamidopyrimidine glycosylase [Candidatus Pacebacteria bacterium]|nr:DNA-formamidopyrimidine glycosylase [Candidatus Paceibacterota bacterium]
MPELPEVETIVRQLNKKVKSLKITKVWFDYPKLLKGEINQQNFKEIVEGKTILKVAREGKNIIFHLSGGWSLIIHLKLTGRILVGNDDFIAEDPYVHFKMELSDGIYLALSDLRKFAKIILEKTEKIKTLEEIKKLGLEPLAKDFTFEAFDEALAKKRSGKIKNILMDQSVVSGIGNIYANEILWKAKVSPFKDIKLLSLKEKREIYEAIKKILQEAIKLRGSTINDEMYRDIKGEMGGYGKLLKAYHQEKCARCGTPIKRTLEKGRATFYCERCQN